MSPEFNAILGEGQTVRDTMHYIQLGAFFVALAVLLLVKPKKLAGLVAFALPVVAAFWAEWLFSDWRQRILAAGTAPDDIQWIGNHDAGTIFFSLEIFLMLFKAGMSWVVLCVVALVMAIVADRKKVKNKPEPELYPI